MYLLDLVGLLCLELQFSYFFLVYLSIIESGILKFTNIITTVSPFSSVNSSSFILMSSY